MKKTKSRRKVTKKVVTKPPVKEEEHQLILNLLSAIKDHEIRNYSLAEAILFRVNKIRKGDIERKPFDDSKEIITCVSDVLKSIRNVQSETQSLLEESNDELYKTIG